MRGCGWCRGFLGKWKGEIDVASEWKKNLFSLPLHVRGRRRYTCSKQHCFGIFLMNNE